MNLANKISITRIILIPLFITSIVYSRMDIALFFFAAAIISDGVDGFIARTQNQKTKLGTILDPLADKFLLVSAFICLSIVKNIPSGLSLPPYVPIIVISRDAIIVLGSVMIHVITGDVKVTPSILGKITTFFQMMTITSVLLQFKYSYAVWNSAAVLTVISGIDYIIKGSRILSENHLISKKAA
ncbi:MAG: CDP-alcohol phosphatidyltransferase family protein [Candidatus Omnitrophica bacterium]|nr:CDP-alcohol phosphatidyltransferase family protein [Candidatus Omnitrophota bacterium]MBI5144246.1 CDP-alcohol phosphatidyltransferase family protein [Candidatus Omnitrophota bacterium]